ncbi:MAG: hypothetical protein K2Y30_14250 [Flavobacteriaceae bacterium]|uniref:Uncharacterized protein n=2 Tax=Flavobacterium TaxID=237 RepID=A0A4R5CFX6_9FLAO|nr:hypothetical protein [Flavobacterium frigoris]EIA07382.1 hypothetical protein HJ01_03289 [Flavobacterium frigoris PS1]MBX9889086.1 hypothetical protein [Flavobacteriaceae bacterium]TDD97896.1 hypothetical protein E0F76_07285 [Flavobacterium cellulosilyticum]
MKKSIAISFLFIFLCANTEIGQLLKIPTLIQHFTEHHDDDLDISFADFIDFHYNNDKQHSDTDKHDNHQNLPFKTINTNVNTILAFESQTAFSFRKLNIISLNRTVPFSQDFYISSVFASIWLPPKLS